MIKRVNYRSKYVTQVQQQRFCTSALGSVLFQIFGMNFCCSFRYAFYIALISALALLKYTDWRPTIVI